MVAMSVALGAPAQAQRTVVQVVASPSFPSGAFFAIPADVDLAVACRSLPDLVRSAAGEFLTDLVAADALVPVREKWAALAESIGAEPGPAFDALLGGEVILALRRTDGDVPDWTLQAIVEPRVEQVIRKRLKVSPRTIAAGQTLYTVERGALELTVVREPDRVASRVILAPTSSALFEEIVRHKVRRPLRVTPAAAALNAPENAHVVVFARLRESPDSWFAMTGSVRDDAFTAQVRGVVRPAEPPLPDDRGWSIAAVREIAAMEHALLAVFDSRHSALAAASALLNAALPQDVLAMLEREDVLTGREAVLLTESPSGPPVILAAAEVRDRARGAIVGDRAMDAMLGRSGVEPRGFDGLAYDAVRRVDDGPAPLAWGTVASERGKAAWWGYTTAPESFGVRLRAIDGASHAAQEARAVILARPDALLRAMREAGAAGAEPPVASVLERVRAIEWIESRRAIPSVHATLTVQFAQR